MHSIFYYLGGLLLHGSLTHAQSLETVLAELPQCGVGTVIVSSAIDHSIETNADRLCTHGPSRITLHCQQCYLYLYQCPVQ